MDETIIVSPIGLRLLASEMSPCPMSTPRTTMRQLRRQCRSRPSCNVLETSPPQRIVQEFTETPARSKELPDGLIKSPLLSPPLSAWDGCNRSDLGGTQPRRFDDSDFRSISRPSCRLESDTDVLVRQVCDIMLASPPPKLTNGHMTGHRTDDDADGSVLKQRQLQRMQQLQFEHPSVNVTPQRIGAATHGLRELLNANATVVRFTPKPPPR